MTAIRKLLPRIALAILAASLNGCQESNAPDPSGPDTVAQTEALTPIAKEPEQTLFETQWILDTLNGHALIPGSTVTADFVSHIPVNYVTGDTGCNSYEAAIGVVNDRLTFPEGRNFGRDVIVTDQPCSTGELDGQQSEFVEAIGRAASYQIIDSRLEVSDAEGQVIFVFTPASP